jgi:hypothetical protein
MADDGDASPFRYHLELTPQQLKITHTALRALRDGYGHDEALEHAIVEEVLAKLPDEHAIRAIQLDNEPTAPEELLAEPPSGEIRPAETSSDDELPPTVA